MATPNTAEKVIKAMMLEIYDISIIIVVWEYLVLK